MDQNVELVITLAGAVVVLALMRIFGIFFLYRIIRWAIRDTLNIRDDEGKKGSGIGKVFFWTLVILIGVGFLAVYF